MAMVAGQPPVGPHSSMPMQIDQAWDDEAIGSVYSALHWWLKLFTDKDDVVIFPDHYAIADEHVRTPVESDHYSTLQLCAHEPRSPLSQASALSH